MFEIALYEPQIAPNTGNIMRLCANNGCHLHLIEPLGFDLEEKKLRRAGLDYGDLSNVTRYTSYSKFEKAMEGKRIFACTTKGSSHFHKANFEKGDVLLFGSETAGLPDRVRDSFSLERKIRIPMFPSNRSLNLSNAVAIIAYEAWRQIDFDGGS